MFVTVWCFWIRFVQRIWYIGLKLYLPKDLCICVCALQKRAQKYKRIQRENERDREKKLLHTPRSALQYNRMLEFTLDSKRTGEK